MPVVVYCKDCLKEGSNTLCTASNGPVNDKNCSIYMYENIESISGSAFSPSVHSIVRGLCTHRGHSRSKIMEIEQGILSGDRENIRRQIVRSIEEKGSVEGTVTL